MAYIGGWYTNVHFGTISRNFITYIFRVRIDKLPKNVHSLRFYEAYKS